MASVRAAIEDLGLAAELRLGDGGSEFRTDGGNPVLDAVLPETDLAALAALLDAMDADPELFTREDAVEASWRIVDPVIGDKTPVQLYEPGSWGPADADRIIARSGGWHDPKVHE